MTHDDEWLDLCATHDAAERDAQIQFARDYHDHMSRWRPVSELPPVCRLVECLIDNGSVETQYFIAGVDEKRIQQYVGWRPISMPVQPDWFTG